jgi:hypothetical protein
VEAITADGAAVRNLSKPAWVLITILLFEIGALLWFIAGRPRATASVPSQGSTGVPPEYDRPGRAVAQNPDDDAAFLEGLRRRTEEQRRIAEEQRRLAEEARRQREQGDDA